MADEEKLPELSDFLRGRELLVNLAIVVPSKVEGEPLRWVRAIGRDGGPVIEQVGIRMSMNVLAEIEDEWGSTTEWTRATQVKTVKTARDTLAICLRRDREAVGEAMLEDEGRRYVTAIGAAFAIANGVDPQVAAETVRAVVAAAPDQLTQIVETIQTHDSLGGTGLPDGSDLSPVASDDPPPSSGT